MKTFTLDDLKEKFLRKWRKGELFDFVEFPLLLTDKFPTVKAYDRYKLYADEEFKLWLEKLESDCQKKGFALDQMLYVEKRFSVILPTKLICPSLNTLLAFIGVEKEWRDINELKDGLCKIFPELLPCFNRYAFRFLRNVKTPDSWESVLGFAKHIISLAENAEEKCFVIKVRNTDILLDNLSTEGVDTKFYETHKTLINCIIQAYCELKQIDLDIQFQRTSPLIRYRPLAQGLMNCNEMGIELPLEYLDTARPIEIFKQIKPLAGKVKNVVIVENLNTYLSLPCLPDTLVIFGSGYNAAILREVKWLNDLNLYYWGDLDCAGFQILNNLRQYFPRMKSIYMDNQTLERYGKYKVFYQGNKHYAESLTFLTQEENAVYQVLKEKTEKGYVRLEQEFISCDEIFNVILQ